MGLVDDSATERTMALLEKYDLPVRLREPLSLDSLMAAARKDKKARAGVLRYVVLERIGKAATCDTVRETVVRDLWTTVQ